MTAKRPAITATGLRLLPSVDELLGTTTAQSLEAKAGRARLVALARTVVERLRQDLQKSPADSADIEEPSRAYLLGKLETELAAAWHERLSHRLQRVINATGVIIHTNLGRAPLSAEAAKALSSAAARYCTVEYELSKGQRGKRGVYAEELLQLATGAEAALVVNNCAAAAFLILSVFAQGGEVLVSRGELVEIGGDFRIPDVLQQSGSVLKEVGTTNRTRLSDYERAITERTSMILRVHPSNYRILGFTSTPSLKDLADLTRKRSLLLYEDAGSGALLDLSEFGLSDEPVISRSIAAGADLVSFSGDKLLGGPQAGLIVGRRDLVEQLRRHPLYRALRVDKLIYAALESTLEAYSRERAFEDIPVLRMLVSTKESIADRAGKMAGELSAIMGSRSELSIELIDGESVIGGGAAPAVRRETTLIALRHSRLPSAALEETLRSSDPPVVARIENDRLLIDLRTVSEQEETDLKSAIAKLA